VTLVFAATPEETTFIASWVAARIDHVRGGNFGLCTSAGVVRNGDLVAGVVFNDWQPRHETLQVSIAASSNRWATRGVLIGLFGYAFQTAAANKLWATMPHDRPDVLVFNRKLGFRQEGTLRHHFGPGRHAVISSILRAEWKRSPWGKE